VRGEIEKGQCPDFEQRIQDELHQLGLEGSIFCAECGEDLCNA